MTVTLHFPDDLKAALQARAEAAGMTVEDWLERLAKQQVRPESVTDLQRTDPEEWARHLRAWAETPRPKAPLLPDEAVDRSSFYPEPL